MKRRITVVFEVPEGYEDVHLELCLEDMNLHAGFPVVSIHEGDVSENSKPISVER